MHAASSYFGYSRDDIQPGACISVRKRLYPNLQHIRALHQMPAKGIYVKMIGDQSEFSENLIDRRRADARCLHATRL